MKEDVKELQCQLEKLATVFYNKSGAKVLNIEIRISPWDVHRKVVLEFTDEYEKNTGKVNPVGCCYD